MPLLARAVFAASKSHAESSLRILRRRSASNNISSLRLTEQRVVADFEGLNCLKTHGLSKRCYSSSTVPTNRVKPQAGTSTWRSFLIPGFALTGIGGLFFLIHSNDEKRAVPKGKGEKFERSAIQGPIIGGPFSLIDTEGELVTEKNLLGNWVLVYFCYTSSPDIGPAEVRKMANSINLLESKENIKVKPIFVTIDPQRDTPSHLRTYLQEFDSKIVGLTGPVAAIRQMAQEYRVFFRKVDEEGDDYLIESSHNMYLMNPNMEVARSFGIEYSADELVEAIAKEIKKNGTQAITKEIKTTGTALPQS